MSSSASALWPGVPYAIGAALLFGATAPLSKALLEDTDPWVLAGILYLGAGIGLLALRGLSRLAGRRQDEAGLTRADLPRLALVVALGGGLGPLLLMLGLARTSAATGALLLNLEAVATLGLAWVIFRENVDRRLLIGALAILAGAVVLSWEGGRLSLDPGALLVAGACLVWGIDNNLSRGLSAADPVVIVIIKGLAAGACNLALGLWLGQGALPASALILAGAVTGFFGVGLSLVFFMLGLRHLGAARTGAYFSLAPFIGALIAVLAFQAPVTPALMIAAGLMGVGLWLHLTERHDHEHAHGPIEHDHLHVHDDHHRHDHDGPVTEPHSHWHRHAPMVHRHPHYPDLHHRHDHG